MNNLLASYERILEVLRKISTDTLLSYQRKKTKLYDLELISLVLTAEFMGIDSENHLFINLPKALSFKIKRSICNLRKRRLLEQINDIRLKLAKEFNEFETCFIADSMPLEVCKLARINRSKICKEQQYSAPNRGFCASQKMFFYGYKLHAVCSLNDIFQAIDIIPVSVHDIHFLQDIKNRMSDCLLLVDKGYLSQTIKIDLFNKVNIQLLKEAIKKRIETLFSQLCDQFMIRRNYAKTFQGFKTRILAKITVLTVVQYINKTYFNRNINNQKIKLLKMYNVFLLSIISSNISSKPYNFSVTI